MKLKALLGKLGVKLQLTLRKLAAGFLNGLGGKGLERPLRDLWRRRLYYRGGRDAPADFMPPCWREIEASAANLTGRSYETFPGIPQDLLTGELDDTQAIPFSALPIDGNRPGTPVGQRLDERSHAPRQRRSLT